MTNAYSHLSTLKSSGVLNISGTGYDDRLRELLEAVSRMADRYCNRHFYVLTTTRAYDSDGGVDLHIQDLLSLTSLKTDDNKDRTFETTWAATDYILYPANTEPTQLWGRPYTKVVVDMEAGSKSTFPAGRQTIQITGKWGFRDVTDDVGTDVDDPSFLAIDTAFDVDDGTKLSIGDTILIDSEQLYVTGINATNITVARGVNGTTAASHADDSDISIYRYPAEVVRACLMQSARLWSRKDTPLEPVPRLRQSRYSSAFQELDPDVSQLLSPLRKPAVGVSTS